jgi:hypothetical protein
MQYMICKGILFAVILPAVSVLDTLSVFLQQRMPLHYPSQMVLPCSSYLGSLTPLKEAANHHPFKLAVMANRRDPAAYAPIMKTRETPTPGKKASLGTSYLHPCQLTLRWSIRF